MLISYKPLRYEQSFDSFFDTLVDTAIEETFDDINKVIICFVNRSGSNYLSDEISKLTNYNLAGEYFNPEPVLNNSKEWKATSLDDYVNKLILRQSRNGGFVCKIGWHQILYLKKIGLYNKYFDNAKVILLERENLLEQAVSFYKASVTNQWTSGQDKKSDDVPFDGYKIRDIIISISDNYSKFKAFVSIYNIDHMHLFYEEFCHQKQDKLREIAGFLGVTYVQNDTTQKYKKQFNNVNERLIEDFKAFATTR